MIHLVLRDLADKGQYAAVKALAEQQLSENPSTLPMLALAELNLGAAKQAREHVKRCMDDYESFTQEGLLDLSSLLLQTNQFAQLVKVLQGSIDNSTENATLLARYGFANMMLGQTDHARQALERAYELAPDQLFIVNNLANLCLRQNHLEQAAELVASSFELLNTLADGVSEPQHQQYWQAICANQINLWVRQQNYAEVEAWLKEQLARQQADEIDENAVVYWVLQYAQYLAQNDQHAQASEILKEYARTFPDNIPIVLRLAELAQMQGYFLPAVNLLRRAIQKNEDNIALWANLADVCMHRFPEQARKASSKTLELAEAAAAAEDADNSAALTLANARTLMGRVEGEELKFDKAREILQGVLEQHENFVPALQAMGHLAMQEGRIDEAVELFERVKQINPVQGISALINARQFPDDPDVLEHMERVANTPSLQGSERSGLLFQLASAWEKTGDYQRAFAAVDKANAASRKLLRYSPKAHRDSTARIRFSFGKELYEHRPNTGLDTDLPVFVVGMPRSGTTLVEQILSGHSQIFGAGELGVIPQVIQGLNRWERFVGSGRHYPDCVDDLTPPVVEGIAKKVLDELKEFSPESKHIVDKLPHNFENIGLIKFLFPNAKIISVRRDPRDIAISNYFTDYQAKMGGMGFAYDLTHIGEQLADHNLLMHHWHQVFPDQILEVQYEEVVDNLEGSARKMLDYIGVDWESQVLDFNKLERPVKTASVWQVRQPIYTSSKEKWRNYQDYLAALIKGTNAPIQPDPVQMITLPDPGFLTDGVELFKQDKLDDAEMSFKKMLHHNPEHAACTYMVGLIYLRKGHMDEGIAEIEKAVAKAPWHREWLENLQKAYEVVGNDEKAAELKERLEKAAAPTAPDGDTEISEGDGLDPLGQWHDE